jgi:DDE superfamily endonuclease
MRWAPKARRAFQGESWWWSVSPPAAEASAANAATAAARTPAGPVGRATQGVDYGRRGKSYIFGACKPADGETLTAPSAGRTTANDVDFLARGEVWIPPDLERIYAIMDNLSAHRAIDVLLCSLAHPSWEFVFQPTGTRSLNLIELWWKVWRSLALKG